MVSFEPITAQEFDTLPTNPSKKPSQWDDVLIALSAGQAVRIPGDQKAQRGARIALGRLAKQRSLTLEYRQAPDGLAVRARQADPAGEAPKPTRGRRGRPARNEAEE